MKFRFEHLLRSNSDLSVKKVSHSLFMKCVRLTLKFHCIEFPRKLLPLLQRFPPFFRWMNPLWKPKPKPKPASFFPSFFLSILEAAEKIDCELFRKPFTGRKRQIARFSTFFTLSLEELAKQKKKPCAKFRPFFILFIRSYYIRSHKNPYSTFWEDIFESIIIRGRGPSIDFFPVL